MTRPDRAEPVLPYARPAIDEEDIAALGEVLRTQWLTTGPKVAAFEEAFAQAVQASHAIVVNSGTAALHTACHALGIGPGDEVIVPSLTFAASATAVLMQGGTPVFCDVTADTLLIDPEDVAAKMTDKTKAVIAVDYAGQPAPYPRLRELCRERGVSLIADASHALGAKQGGDYVGTLGDITTFSTHPVKHVATGEGGVITTENADFAESARRFRNHGISRTHREREQKGSWEYDIPSLGMNYRQSDIQCALGLSQLAKLPQFVERRRAIADLYVSLLRDIGGVEMLTTHADNFHSYHLLVVRVSGNRRDVFERLRERGIGVNVHYIPVHLLTLFVERFGTGPGLCPVAEQAYEQILSLPMFPAMSDDDVHRVVAVLKEALLQR